MSQITNNCTDENLDYYIKECSDILGITSKLDTKNDEIKYCPYCNTPGVLDPTGCNKIKCESIQCRSKPHNIYCKLCLAKLKSDPEIFIHLPNGVYSKCINK